MPEQLFDVIAVDMKTGLADAMIGRGKTASEAATIVQCGLDTHFYVTVPTGSLVEGQKYEVAV